MLPGSATRLDLVGLGGSVTLREVATFYRTNRTPYGRRWWVIALIVAVYLAGQMGFIALYAPIAIDDERMLRSILAAIALLSGAYGTVLMALIWRNVARVVRVDRAARANGFDYADRDSLARFSGSVLQRPGRPEASDVLRSTARAGVFDFALATFASSPGLVSRRAGVAEIRLEREVPHIVLENHRARILRRSGDRFAHRQRLKLEGDFDRTFALFCPAGYERDALYIFTPDLMVLLLDLASDCEVELIGDRLVLYAGRPWRLWRPERFARAVAMVETIGRKAVARTSLYRDDHALDLSVADAAPAAWAPRIAAGGRRLRTHPSFGTVLSVMTPLALCVYGLFSLLAP